VTTAPRLASKWRISEGLRFFVACFGFLLVISASSALADESDQGSQIQPSTRDYEKAAEEQSALAIEGPQTDPQAAEELPHRELGREGAQELLSSVFGEIVQEQTAAFDELENATHFYSDHVAVIASEDQAGVGGSGPESQLLLEESVLPLRAENSEGEKEAVDLELTHSEGELQPANPLVEVGIPGQLGEGISLPEAGIEIKLAGAPSDRSASTEEEGTAFYPNVAADSDLTVLPTPTGVETLTQLRSADAPRSETFSLSLPDGASLEEIEGGGALVTKGSESLVKVDPPTAIDAEGRPVPASLTASGNAITVHVAPEQGAVYPILVDPVYESGNYWQLNNSTEGIGDWTAASNSNRFGTPTRGAFGEPGLNIYSYTGSIAPGSQANWNWYVPRFFSDWENPTIHKRPTSYVHKMTFSQLHWWIEEAKPYKEHPFVMIGLWDESSGWWNSLRTRNGIEGELQDPNFNYEPTNQNEDVNVKSGGVAMATFESESRPRHLLVGQAVVQFTDQDYPKGTAAGPNEWMNTKATSAINFNFSDPGLGIYSMLAKTPKLGGGTIQWSQGIGCFGDVGNSCPRTWSGGFWNYEPTSMPQGEDYVEMIGRDPIAHFTDQEPGYAPVKALVKVDHTAPTLGALSGSMTEQATLGATRPQYSLKYAAADGNGEQPAFVSSFGAEGAGNGQLKHPADLAVDPNGNLWIADENNNRIEKFNEKGEYAAKYGALGSGNGQLSHPTALEVDSKGNLWVADTGNNRVEEFNEKGEYVAKFGSAGTSSGQLSSPEGIAIDPKGNIWVADTHNNRLQKFSEKGTVLKIIGSKGSSPGLFNEPSGIDISGEGNIWVADAANNRLQEFNENGDFLRQVGNEGTGTGQFKRPDAIDIGTKGSIWVGDQGNNRVERFTDQGEYLGQFGSKGTGPGQLGLGNPIGIAVGPSGVWVTDSNNNRIEDWSTPKATQSGVVGMTVKLDNKVVASPIRACASGNCSWLGEWILHSNEVPVGIHTVEVSATDGVSLLSTPKKITINIARDTTRPQLTSAGSLFTAPEGWLEQKLYSYSASAKDPNGSGVVSLSFKIDGKEVANASQPCPNGACEATISSSLNMANFAGGTHTAELIAKDGSGNSESKAWTLNVDPKGAIGTEEATHTLEAVEDTGGETIVSPTAAEPSLPMESEAEETEPHLEITEDTLHTAGAPSETTLGNQPEDGFTIGTSEGPVSIKPSQTGGAATDVEPASDAAAVSGNTTSSVDTVIRPIYDGDLTFQAIRDASASSEYLWDVSLSEGQYLRALDEEHAEVYNEGGQSAFGVRVIPAHDAVGTAVPTALAVIGPHTVALRVQFKAGNPAAGGAPFVYPIVAGAGWEGGFQTFSFEIPPPEPPPGPDGEGESEEGAEIGGATATTWWISAPEHATPGEANISAATLSNWEKSELEHRRFRYIGCHYQDDTIPGYKDNRGQSSQEALCGNPFTRNPGPDGVAFNYAIAGNYFRVSGVFTKHVGSPTDNIQCDKMMDPSHFGSVLIEYEYFVDPAEKCLWWGETQYGRESVARNENGNSHHLTPFGEWNWGRAMNGPPWSTSQSGLALYLWSSKRNYIGHHPTTCIDC
jgi:sugar lactone lactonase YvrE